MFALFIYEDQKNAGGATEDDGLCRNFIKTNSSAFHCAGEGWGKIVL